METTRNKQGQFVKSTLETFMEKAKSKHNDKYDYSKTIYIKSTEKIEILCKTHGSFFQTPKAHLQGQGCPICARVCLTRQNKKTFSKKPKKTLTLKDKFIIKANSKHNNKYDYSKINYIDGNTHITIICPVHGEFTQRPKRHLVTSGCDKCARALVNERKRDTLKDFIKKATKVHGSTYDYSKVVYTTSKTKVEIGCPIHGSFFQLAGQHTLGKGCKKCAMENLVKSNKDNHVKPYNYGTWHYSKWEAMGKRSKNFEGFKLYVIRIFNQNEEFIKIGKTFVSLHKRLSKLPYEWIKIAEVEGSATYISELEKKLHKQFKPYTYTPKISFDGTTECFTTDIEKLMPTDFKQ